MTSIQAHCLCDTGAEGPGHLSRVSPNCETGKEPQDKIPRVTMATWKFSSGAVGNLTHIIALHGKKTARTFEVFLDGLYMILLEVQTTNCRLLVRRGDTDDYESYDFGGDDPYDLEIRTFLAACRSGDATPIRSSYEDAIATHEFTMAIREACGQ